MLINVYGYSPLQLVTGKQPKLPGYSCDKLPALGEEPEETKGISKIAQIHNARKAFMEIENSSRLKKALLSRPVKRENYQIGDMVYFRYGPKKGWHGPARVIAVDNKIIYLKYGRAIVHTSEPRVSRAAASAQTNPLPTRPTTNPTSSRTANPNSTHTPTNPTHTHSPITRHQTRQLRSRQPVDSDDSDDEDQITAVRTRVTTRSQAAAGAAAEAAAGTAAEADGDVGGAVIQNQAQQQFDPNVSDPEEFVQHDETPEINSPVLRTPSQSPDKIQSPKTPPHSPSHSPLKATPPSCIKKNKASDPEDSMWEEEMEEPAESPTKMPMLPKRGAIIFVRKKKDKRDINQGEFWMKCQFLFSGTKRKKGKIPPNPWMNVEREDGGQEGFYHDDVDWCYSHSKKAPVLITHLIHYDDQYENPKFLSKDEAMIKESYVTFVPKNYWSWPCVKAAKEKEIANFQKWMAYKEIEDEGQDAISSGWVITEKYIEGKKCCKARLVVHGNQSLDEIRTDSPTVSKSSLRIQFSWQLNMGGRSGLRMSQLPFSNLMNLTGMSL